MVNATCPEGELRPRITLDLPYEYWQEVHDSYVPPPPGPDIEASEEELARDEADLDRVTGQNTANGSISAAPAEASVDHGTTNIPRVTSSGVELAPGWIERTPPPGERPYYVHSTTYELTYDLSVAQGFPSQTPDPAAIDRQAADTPAFTLDGIQLAHGWKEYRDPGEATYYFNPTMRRLTLDLSEVRRSPPKVEAALNGQEDIQQDQASSTINTGP